MSQVIVVARVDSKLTTRHTPYDSNTPEQHSVWSCSVIKTLKQPFPTPLQDIKVSQAGGDLPWTDGHSTGIGYRVDGQPLLQIGQTYLLFLQVPAIANPLLERVGFVPAGTLDKPGRGGELDEWPIASPPRGAILIRDGILALPSEPSGMSVQPWQFVEEPKALIGLSLTKALNLVSQAVDADRHG
jgi:hypothetical protein